MRAKRNLRNLLNLLALTAASFLVFSCGLKGGSPNAGTPSGTLVGTGTMSGSATATVGVYSQGSGTYAVQLASLNYSPGCGTSIGVVAGSFVSGPTLSATSGTENYTFSGLSSTPTEVFLYCTATSPIQNGIVATAGPPL